MTSLEEGTVYKIGPNGGKEEYAKVKGKLTGIIHISEQSFLLNGWNEEGIPTIHLLENNQVIVPLLSLPDALFLNGIAALDNNLFLICDSYKGCIWKFDLKTNKAEVWLQHVLLSRIDENNPMPAANGIKIFENTVFVSNTAKQLLIKIKLNDGKAGTPEIIYGQNES